MPEKHPDEWKVKGKRKRKLDPAFEDLIYDGKEERALTLKDLCHYWAVLKMLSEDTFQINKIIYSKSKTKKVPKNLKPTLMYAYSAFSQFAKENLPHLKTKSKALFIKYMMGVSLVQNARLCSCKTIFNFIEQQPKLIHPPEHYEALTPYHHRQYIKSALENLKNPEKLRKVLRILGLPPGQ